MGSKAQRAASWFFLWAGCGVLGCSGDSEGAELDDGDAEPRLSAVGANVLVTPGPNSLGGNETSAVGFPTANTLFVSYNSSTGGPSCGWSYSTNGGTSFTSTDDRATPLPGFLGSDGSAFTRCLGDTWSTDVSWSAGSPVVAMVAVTLHATDPGPCGTAYRDVAMWTGSPSNLSGGKVAILSDQLGSGGCTDGPKVEWDPTNHTAWVWWWNDDQTFLRPVAIAANGTMTPGATIDLTGTMMVDEKHATMAIKPAAGAGASPTIWLSYPSIAGDESLSPCNLATSWDTIDMYWWLSKSVDGGATWTHLELDHDSAWPVCLSATPRGGNRSIVSSVYDPSSQRVLLSYSRHIDDANGNFVGTRVVTKQTPTAGGNANAFNRWLPLCNPALCPPSTPTGSSCLVQGAPPVGETFCHQYGPSAGVKGSGTRKFAAVFHDTRDSGLPHPAVGDAATVKPLESDIWGYSIQPGAPFDSLPRTMSRVTPLGPGVPWKEKSTNLNLWWGDYEGGVVGFGSTFYAIWGDNRDGTTTTKLMGASFND